MVNDIQKFAERTNFAVEIKKLLFFFIISELFFAKFTQTTLLFARYLHVRREFRSKARHTKSRPDKLFAIYRREILEAGVYRCGR